MTAPPADAQPWLPALLRAMADAFDLDTALRFARLYGGTYLYLPREASPDHPLAQEFGLPLLRWLLTTKHGGAQTRIVVPRGPDEDRAMREAAVAQLTADGLNASQIARRLKVHVRTVHNARARIHAATMAARQGRLFGGQG